MLYLEKFVSPPSWYLNVFIDQCHLEIKEVYIPT